MSLSTKQTDGAVQWHVHVTLAANSELRSGCLIHAGSACNGPARQGHWQDRHRGEAQRRQR